MTPTTSFLAALAARGVVLAATAGGRLRVDAPAGVLTEADRQSLAAGKAELLQLAQAAAVVRRLWPDLLGTLGVSARQAALDLACPTGEPEIDVRAAELRRILAGEGPGLDRLVAAGVLIPDSGGRLSAA